MIKYIGYILLISFSLLFMGKGKAQCTITIESDSAAVPCSGATIGLRAIVDNVTAVMDNDFNDSAIGSGWQSSPAASFYDPCGTVDGSHVLWMGDQAAAPRELITLPLDVSCGGRVCFDLKFAKQGELSPCEGPDSQHEGVNFEVSHDNGLTWDSIFYFEPDINGCLYTDSVNGSCTGNYTQWQNFCFDIPANSWTDTTIFKWWQSGGSGANNDHWGMDNIRILATNCDPGSLDWAHIPGSPDLDFITETITQETTFNVSFTSSSVDCNASITIYIDTLENFNITANKETCVNGQNGEIDASVSGGSPPYQFYISGPVMQSNTSGSFTNLPSGLYNVNVADAGGCDINRSSLVEPGVNVVLTADAKSLTCNELNAPCDGSLLVTPTQSYGPLQYIWLLDGDTIVNSDTNFRDSICTGMYKVIAIDSNGCKGAINSIISHPYPITAYFKTQTEDAMVIKPEVRFLNQSAGATSFLWDFDSLDFTFDEDTSYEQDPSYTFVEEVNDYLVCLKAMDMNGCYDIFCRNVRIEDYPRVYIPNSFTPDGDGINDSFFPYLDDIGDKNYLFTIFDRWGQIVFQTNDYKASWDGRIKGQKVASQEVFSWTLVYSNVFGQIKRYRGSVTLLK